MYVHYHWPAFRKLRYVLTQISRGTPDTLAAPLSFPSHPPGPQQQHISLPDSPVCTLPHEDFPFVMCSFFCSLLVRSTDAT
ncbi:hypothetical protein E2C01_101081 [Portunus trituberculatus]|uniref:Uncharacterized protein n=1 Tax=Portunus trituberculatus TaxID=210409 RepID=A0A5B7K4S4_PORTR|nr:hypothetical protein [Portunus trituberculatus]